MPFHGETPLSKSFYSHLKKGILYKERIYFLIEKTHFEEFGVQ